MQRKIPDQNNMLRNEELEAWFNMNGTLPYNNNNPNATAPPPPFLNRHNAHVPSRSSIPTFAEFPQNAVINGGNYNLLVDDDDLDMGLSMNFSGMRISDDQQGNHNFAGAANTRRCGTHDDPYYGYGFTHHTATPFPLDDEQAVKTRGGYGGGADLIQNSYYGYGFPPHAPCPLDVQHARVISGETSHGTVPLYEQQSHQGVTTVTPSSDLKWGFTKGHTFGPPMESSMNPVKGSYYGQVQPQKPSFQPSPYSYDNRFQYARSVGYGFENCECDDPSWDVKNPSMYHHPQNMQQAKVALNQHYYTAAARGRGRVNNYTEIPNGRDPVAFKCDNSYIIQEKAVNGHNPMLGYKRNSHSHSHREVVPRFTGEKNSSAVASEVPQLHLPNFRSLIEVQGYMHLMAKDQNGCRFLQRMVEEGTQEDVLVVFKGIINNVVELMVDPFGNYLVQKLLELGREDQRYQIVLMLTKEPGQLVRISLNTHGTRVVQNLIGTLRSRDQISLVTSAIQPGFLDLIKDLNGNHVIQRCLQCLSCQDNEFIFDAAAKFCVEIATHQHGCCVLQRCIDYSTGKYHDKLVKEISRHGLLLAQDPYGNYVVQYIIEKENPSASAKLASQFKGNYVNLSTQKFSSHVVEKCLRHVAEIRPRIVQEMLSIPHFDQLMQDPFANYVLQRALEVTKGSLHASLVEAIRPYKFLRTSPYCKRIFSRNLLKR